jgi:hypothetical protein
MGRHLNGTAAQTQNVDQFNSLSDHLPDQPELITRLEQSADLWSLPEDATPPEAGVATSAKSTAPPTSADHLVAAWISAIEPSAGTDQASDDATKSGAAEDTVPRAGQHSASRHTREPWHPTLVTMLISIIISAAAGLITVTLLAQFTALADTDEPHNDSRGTTSTDLDDRVTVPGLASGCVTMLVKPRADGTTTQVGGTCFSVG